MINLAFIMAFIGAAIAMLIGMTIFAGVDDSIDCSTLGSTAQMQCESTKDTAWIIIGILPVAMFFLMFTVMGGLTEDMPNPLTKLRQLHVKHPKGGWKAKWVEPKKTKITIFEKMLIWLGLAKATRRE